MTSSSPIPPHSADPAIAPIHSGATRAITKNATWIRGKDLWLRARTNALAHEVRSKKLKTIANYIFIIQTIFVVIPIVLISLSLQATNAEIQQMQIRQMKNPQTEVSYEGTYYKTTSFLAIFSNGIAFLLSILSTRFRWTERALKNDELLAMYSLIAQRARRLEDGWMSEDEGKLFCRTLQELFETAKNRGSEPSMKDFKNAQRLMASFNAYPFDFTREDIINSSGFNKKAK